MNSRETVAYNVDSLISFNRSMAVALDKAENGSSCEDGYFIEKLRKTAESLGYELTSPDDKPKKAEEIKPDGIEELSRALQTQIERAGLTLELQTIKSWINIALKRINKTEEIGESICLNNQTTTNLIQYLRQFPPGSPVKISHDYKNWDCQIACNFEHQKETGIAQLMLGLFIDDKG